MSKTWETLFNLSSFMRYLLLEALPDEKLEAPSYILDSLYDLLTATSAWIEKIKPSSTNNTLVNYQLSESSARTNSSKNYFTSNIQTDKNPLPLSNLPKDVPNNTVKNLENSSIELSDVFLKLSKEMINGRPFGHYCIPCDCTIYFPKDWNNHIADRFHSYLQENFEFKLRSCDHCGLIIFASFRDANKLLKCHELEHYSRNNNCFSKENVSEREIKKNPQKVKENDLVKHNRDVADGDIEVNSCFKTSQSMSPVFIELDKKMHSGKEKGFYCHVCDKEFEVVTDWNRHFQNDAHNDQINSSGCFEKCESCNLVIFAVPSIQKWYKAHHMCGHYCFEGKKKSNSKSSVENLQLAAQSKENLHLCSNNAPNKINNNTYKICQQFKNFNEKIHNNNLQGHFYCRPCNAALSPEEWIKHSNNKRHLELMASRKFKNWKGTCTYCSFSIIGTHDTVKYYMEFHSQQHKKVISYDFVKISSNNTPNNGISSQSKKKSRARKIASPNSMSTLDNDEDVSDFDDKDINNSKIEPTSSGNSASGESSWYTSSREEQLHNAITQLIESRTNEKYATGEPEFGALCTLCEFKTNDGFDWYGHLSSNDHRHRKTFQDRHGKLSDLNIEIIGNINVFEKYKSLVKGNWSFIEN